MFKDNKPAQKPKAPPPPETSKPAPPPQEKEAETPVIFEPRAGGRIGMEDPQMVRRRSGMRSVLGDTDLADASEEQLLDCVRVMGLQVEGTGTKGAVLRDDLIAAVQAAVGE